MTTTAELPVVPFTASADLLGDAPALRARAAADGYLFLPRLLPRDAVLRLRQLFLGVLDRHGWLAAGAPVDAGVVDAAAYAAEPPDEVAFCGVGVPPPLYRDVYRIPEFHALAHHPRLLQLYRTLFGAEVFVHPRKIGRLMVAADRGGPTPPHQDFIHIQGSPRTWTAWFPLGDCPVSLGGLAVLVGSQREGILSYKAAAGAGGLEAYLCGLDLPWATGDYRAGDVVTFNSATVHRALPNGQPDRVRLSCDYRYQPAADVVDPSSLDVHCGMCGWDDVYAGWPADHPLRWYWRSAEPPHSVWDESIRWQQRRIC